MAGDDARLEALESKVTFQEDIIQKLNDVVIEQNARLHDLERSLRLVLASLRDQGGGMGIDGGIANNNEDEQPPPHY